MGRWQIPVSTVVTLRRGQSGIVVWSLQKALNALNTIDAIPDGQFGPATEASAKVFQGRAGLAKDGIVGPATQAALVGRLLAVDDNGLPPLLLSGFSLMEGGNLLGAVNDDVDGGIDCGTFQRRVFDEDYAVDAVIERAFNTAYQSGLLANRLLELRPIFQARAGTQDGYNGMPTREKAWRLAALNHNYPTAADRLSRTPIRSLDNYWRTDAPWTKAFDLYVDGKLQRDASGNPIKTWARFPGGVYVKTPLQWAHNYSGILGGEYGHKGNVTRFVTNWMA